MSATEFPLVMKGICEENLEDLRTLNRALFPINYTERVYADILACGDVSQLAYDAEGHLVGGIGCRLENTPQGPMLYVLTLGVLAPYRGQGIGRRLLRATLEVVRECLPEVTYSRLHVQVGNETALRLY
ncbi:hypothetical protein QBZ16_003479 [Prototheca wickerhamii]|uniref:N-acetyltransferase domain-containing protein n=1 Tax=Prototheca wickerhamii TaxID=3111 RepID=A0AAD9IK27_PROWI|nr:hypothetical protein QBZ16_003479 [Prototheca wickerhamii]